MTTSKDNRPGWGDLRSPPVLLATWGGLGLSPAAPGTAGSLGALPFIYLGQFLPFALNGLIVVLLTVVGIWVSGRVDQRWGGHDHSEIVIDEVVGQWLAISPPLFLLAGLVPDLWFFALGFLLFRLFDIVKPPPVSWCDQKLTGGLGVMADDVVAGVMAGSVLSLLVLLLSL